MNVKGTSHHSELRMVTETSTRGPVRCEVMTGLCDPDPCAPTAEYSPRNRSLRRHLTGISSLEKGNSPKYWLKGQINAFDKLSSFESLYLNRKPMHSKHLYSNIISL